MALGKTKHELLQAIDSEELIEWQAFYRLNPFGLDRGDLQASIVASTIANVNRDAKSKPYGASDFMPVFGETKEQKRPINDELILAQVQLINARLGGMVIDNG